MPLLHLVLLALIQGITEFLPISSSGHLILLPHLAGWRDQGLAYDVAAHLGTLLAVVVYFRGDLLGVVRAGWPGAAKAANGTQAQLGRNILIATIPVCVAGAVFYETIGSALRSPILIAITTIIFGAALLVADRLGARRRHVTELKWRDAVWIGCAQALALIPGTSRSGITMTAGLLLGLTRTAAARFSFLLAVPVIALAGGYQCVQLLRSGVDINWFALALVTVLAGASAMICIHWFLRLFERIGMLPFALYRFALGGLLLWFFALRG